MMQKTLAEYQAQYCKNLLGVAHKPCGAVMFHLHRGGIEYDYCPVCFPKIDPEKKFSISTVWFDGGKET